MLKRLVSVALVAAVVLAVGAGCSSKKKGSGADGEEGTGAGISEEGVTPGGSLDRYKEGEDLGAGGAEQGPLKDMNFAFDSYELDDDARGVLRGNADWLKEHPESRVEIEGHCDERGTVEYNLALGAKRAKAAKDYLVTLGIAANRLGTISYGEELPLCREHSEGCWAENRRCHFVVLNQ